MRMFCNRAVLLVIPALVLFGTGCTGISTSQGVSPATFLMPGFFGQTAPAVETPPLPAVVRPESEQSIVHAN